MPKIAYLFGAGAAQGEVEQTGGRRKILMDDLVSGIINTISEYSPEEKLLLADVTNYLTEEFADIERLITLYEASGISKNIQIAQRLKSLFRKELEDRVSGFSDEYEPGLFAALLDMHNLESLNEELVLVMTTNYEDLIEQAMLAVHGRVNYVIKTQQTENPYSVGTVGVPILKLHGSFNWKNESPLIIQKEIVEEQDVTWIPPGIAKKRESYPFDLIWGKARELLECDVLRIIGSSLSMNDWELVSLVHTTQKLRSDQQPAYAIEFIDYPNQGLRIKAQHKYLDIKTVLDIGEFKDYMVREYDPDAIGQGVTEERLEELAQQYLNIPQNMFAHWLRAKGEALYFKGTPIKTDVGYFEKFVLPELAE